MKCPHVNEVLRDSIGNFDIFSFALFFSIFTLRRYGRKNIHGAVFHRIATTPQPFFIWTISDFFYYRRDSVEYRGKKGGGGVGKREISRADKRVRFIASLILFIDTRIALRLRSQQLRRRNSVAKLGRVKTPPKCCLLAQFYRSRSYISFACVDNTHISQLALVRYLVTKLPVITANSSQSC